MVPFYEKHNGFLYAEHDTVKIDFPAHFHPNLEIVYIIRGDVKVTFGKEESVLHAGDLFLSVPNLVHSYCSLEESSQTERYLIICNIKIEDTTLGFPQIPIVRSKDIHKDILYALESLVMLYNSNDQPKQILAETFLKLLLLRTLPYMDREQIAGKYNDIEAMQITNYMQEHFQESLNLSQLEKDLKMSRYHISRVFSNIIGMSFSDYLHTLRIHYAKRLLLETDWSIMEIALESGFETQQTFNRAFQHIEKVTPSTFRKTARQTNHHEEAAGR